MLKTRQYLSGQTPVWTNKCPVVVRIWHYYLRIDSTIPNAIGQRGTVVDFVRLQRNEKFDKEKRPAANDKTWKNLNLIQAIRRMPRAWLKYATEVAIWFSDDCYGDGTINGILDELDDRLRDAPSNDPPVKLHLINTSSSVSLNNWNILRSFFTTKPAGRIDVLHPRLKLTTLQLHYHLSGGVYMAMQQLFDYFSGTQAKTKLILRNVGGGYNQLAFIHRATNGTERFPNLAAMELHRDQLPGQPNWTVLADFQRMSNLIIIGSIQQEFIVSLPNPVVAMNALRAMRLVNVQLQDARFISSMPELEWLHMERVFGHLDPSVGDFNQVCGAMRNQRLRKLHVARFHLGSPDRQRDLNRLQSVLEAAGANNCPNLHHLDWRGSYPMVLQDAPQYDIRRIFQADLTAGSLDQTNFILRIRAPQPIHYSINVATLHAEIIKLAAATKHTGLKQLKFKVRFRHQEPNWPTIEGLINGGNNEFSAKFRSAVGAVYQLPLPLLHIDCDNRMQLLITKRTAPVRAADVA